MKSKLTVASNRFARHVPSPDSLLGFGVFLLLWHLVALSMSRITVPGPVDVVREFVVEIPTGAVGDIYDRYLVRIEEMRQSCRILDQALRRIPVGPVNVDDPKIFLPPKKRVLTSMEELIHQFMLVTEGFECPAGEVYHSTEVPKGELGFYIVSTGEKAPYRLRIRSPSFNTLAVLPLLCEGGLVADVVAVIGSLDPVMGEVDR